MQRLGRVVSLQVQTDSIKTGRKPHERYTPTPHLVGVCALHLSSDGVVGVNESGATLPDVHNRTHPHSKWRGNNSLSIGFTGHYAEMRSRFGDHLVDGIAAESVLIEHDGLVELPLLNNGIVVRRGDQQIEIGPWEVAHPCAPFAKFCLKYPDNERPDHRITEALRFLENGMRGFLANWHGEPTELRLGDEVFIPSR